MKLSNLSFTYQDGDEVILKDISLSFPNNGLVSLCGPSGSGKTTLLNILAALDRPTNGIVRLNGKDITKIKDKQISSFRREHLGFVFQDFNLLNNFSNKDNILLPFNIVLIIAVIIFFISHKIAVMAYQKKDIT